MASRRRRLEWTARAQSALNDALTYVARESPAAAEHLLIRILDAAETLTTLTERGRVVPELDESTIREIVVPPYRLIYGYDEAVDRILAVVHEARDL